MNIWSAVPAMEPNSAFLRRHRVAFRESHLVTEGIDPTSTSASSSLLPQDPQQLAPSTPQVSFALNNDSFVTDRHFMSPMGSTILAEGSAALPLPLSALQTQTGPLPGPAASELDLAMSPVRGARKPKPSASKALQSLQQKQKELEKAQERQREDERWDKLLATWSRSDWGSRVKGGVQRALQSSQAGTALPDRATGLTSSQSLLRAVKEQTKGKGISYHLNNMIEVTLVTKLKQICSKSGRTTLRTARARATQTATAAACVCAACTAPPRRWVPPTACGPSDRAATTCCATPGCLSRCCTMP